MKNIYGNQVTEKKSYYVPHMSSFFGILKVLDYLPSFNNVFKEKSNFTLTYYDTPNGFLKNMGVIVSFYEYKHKNIVHFEYNTSLIKDKEQKNIYDLELDNKESILSNRSLRFIEDRLSVIFGTKLQIDIFNALKKIVPEYKVDTARKIYDIDHNTGFKSRVYMDEVLYLNVKTKKRYSDRIFEIYMISAATDFNKDLFNRILKYIKEKVVLVDMNETRLDAIKLFTSLKRKEKRK